MKSNLFEEVRLTNANDPSFNFDAWKESVLNEEPYDHAISSKSNSMDMGWQKRSSGRRYDSSSGHAFLVGIKTRKPVAMCLKSSFCSVCCYHMKRHNLAQEEVPEHECVANHQGSAGSMESAALIEMIESLYYGNQVSVSKVITDDDSKMKAQCKWSNKDFLAHHNYPPGEKKWLIVGSKKVSQKLVKVYRKDGLLQFPVPEPTFLADPAHRKKTFRNKLYLIKGQSVKKKHGIQDGDILRLTMYYAYFIHQLQGIHEEKWMEAAKAIVDHHFNTHDRCGDWCKQKMETEEESVGGTTQGTVG